MSDVALSPGRHESATLLGSLPGEVQQIVRPLVEPLLDQWDALVGDHEAVREAAHRWRDVGRHLDDVADRQHRTVTQTQADWVGLAQDGWAAAGDEVGAGLTELAARARDVGACLDEASVAVQETERLVGELVRELLEWAALTLAVSVVTGLVTWGASTLAAAAAAAGRAAVTGSRIAALVLRLAAVLRRVQDRVERYRVWLDGLPTVRRRAVELAEQQVVSQVVRRPVRAAATEVTGMDGHYREPLQSLLRARTGEPHRRPG